MATGSLEDALARVNERILETLSDTTPGFPHYADQNTGEWTRSSGGDWTGGFWVGQLWLTATDTGDARLRAAARLWSSRLEPRISSDTIFRGFMFWYGAAAGSLLLGDDDAEKRALAGARALATSYNPRAGLMPLGDDAEEASNVGHDATNIDGVPGGTPLLAWAAEHDKDRTALRHVAFAHAMRHSELCVRRDGSVCQSAGFDRSTGALVRRYTHKGCTDDSTWTRAQAWAMLGFAQAAHRLGEERFAALAACVGDWWCDHLPAANVAYWYFDAPVDESTPLDTSGTAVAAVSLFKTAALPPSILGQDRIDRYRTTAKQMIAALVEHHLTPLEPGERRPVGMLLDGCYNLRIDLAPRSELIWGDYFLHEALLVLVGRLDPTLL